MVQLRIAEIVYVGKCDDSHSVSRPQKIWIDTVKDCIRKRGLDVGQAKEMLQDRSELQGFVRANAYGIAWGMSL